MAELPKRINNHEIDTEACKLVATKISRDWEIRDITGRDFGIDKMIERFHEEYATSEILLLQIKGSDKIIDTEKPSFSIDTKTLLYAEMFAVPFILVYCSISNPEQCYYVWLQEYIKVRLNYDKLRWREQDSNTIYFPKENILGTKYSEEHLSFISSFPKYKEACIQYYINVIKLLYIKPESYCIDEMSSEGILKYATEVIRPLQQILESSKYIYEMIENESVNKAIASVNKILKGNVQSLKEEYLLLEKHCAMVRSTIQWFSLWCDDDYKRGLYEADKAIIY